MTLKREIARFLAKSKCRKLEKEIRSFLYILILYLLDE